MVKPAFGACGSGGAKTVPTFGAVEDSKSISVFWDVCTLKDEPANRTGTSNEEGGQFKTSGHWRWTRAEGEGEKTNLAGADPRVEPSVTLRTFDAMYGNTG